MACQNYLHLIEQHPNQAKFTVARTKKFGPERESICREDDTCPNVQNDYENTACSSEVENVNVDILLSKGSKSLARMIWIDLSQYQSF